MNTEKAAKITDTFRILADPTRLRILYLLFHARKELCVGEIAEAVGVSHSAASHQLEKLEARHVVKCFRMGRMMCYEVEDNSLTRQLRHVITLAY